MLPLTALTLLAGSAVLNADCQRPPQGIPGFLSANYIGSYSDTVLVLANDDPVDVPFQIDSTPPVGIIKSGTDDSFTIQNTGVYLIYWTVNAQTIHDLLPLQTLALTLQVNGSPVMASPSSFTSFPNLGTDDAQLVNISGRATLVLQENDVVSLEALATFNPNTETVQITSALFDIVEIPSIL